MSNKKGVSAGISLVMIIIGLAFAIMMLVLLNSGDSPIPRENCGTTVDRMDLFNRAGLPIDDEDLNCPVVTITIDNKDDNKENSRIMANAMYDCATQFRRGKKQLFTNEGVYCSVCYLFDVQEPVEGFYGYLLKTTVPDSSGETYHEYMQGFRTVGAEKILEELERQNAVPTGALSENEEIIPGTERTITPLDEMENMRVSKGDYAVIFIYARGEEHFKKIWRHLTAQTPEGKAGMVAGGVSFLTFSTGGVAAAYLIPGFAATGPVGWVIIGSGVVLGAASYAAINAITERLSDDLVEYVSFFVFKEWDTSNPDRAAHLLTHELKCDYLFQ